MNQEKAQHLLNRMGEHGADIEQILQKLNQVYDLAIESTEERINPKLSDPVEVKVRVLAVARAAAMDMYAIHKDLQKAANPVGGNLEGNGDVTVYELIKSWVDADEDWTP